MDNISAVIYKNFSLNLKLSRKKTDAIPLIIFVLILPWINFFTVATVELYFVLEIVLLTPVSAPAEQYLHCIKAFSASDIVAIVNKLEMHNRVGGDSAGTAYPN